MAMREGFETLIGTGETVLRDGLRGARHAVRQGPLSLPNTDPLGRIAAKLDHALLKAEHTALSPLRRLRGQGQDPAALIAEFPAVALAGAERFVPAAAETMDRLAATLLAHWGVASAFVSGHEIRAAAQGCAATRRALASGQPEAIRVRLVAIELALAAIRRKAVLDFAVPAGGTLAPILKPDANGPVFLAAALSLAAYAERETEETAGPVAYLAAAATAVEVRRRAFEEALAARDPIAALSQVFARIIPALP